MSELKLVIRLAVLLLTSNFCFELFIVNCKLFKGVFVIMPIKILSGDMVKFAEKIRADALVIPVCEQDIRMLSNDMGLRRSLFSRALFAGGAELRKKLEDNFRADGEFQMKFGEIIVTNGCDLNVRNILFVYVEKPPHDMTPRDFMYEYRRSIRECYVEILDWAHIRHAESVVCPVLGIDLIDASANYFSPKTEFLLFRGARVSVSLYAKEMQSEMNIYLVTPPDTRPVQLEQNKDTAEQYNDVFIQYERRFNEDIKNSGLTKSEFCKKRLSNYLYNFIDNAEQLANMIDYDKGSISKFRSGKIARPKKHRVIAMAIGMGLSDEDRYCFIKCAGYDYPVDERDRIVEKLIRAGVKDFSEINERLIEIDKEFAL